MSHFDKVTEHISKFKTRTAQQQTFLKDGKAKACRLHSSQSLSKLCEEPKKLYPAKTEQLKQLLNMDMDQPRNKPSSQSSRSASRHQHHNFSRVALTYIGLL